MKHTPGPWTCDDLGVIRDPDGRPVQTASKNHGGETWNNALLIGASPDLLLSTKHLLDICHDYLPHANQQNVAAYLQAAKEAITKAGGRI